MSTVSHHTKRSYRKTQPKKGNENLDQLVDMELTELHDVIRQLRKQVEELEIDNAFLKQFV